MYENIKLQEDIDKIKNTRIEKLANFVFVMDFLSHLLKHATKLQGFVTNEYEMIPCIRESN